jgi:hypothetical protein
MKLTRWSTLITIALCIPLAAVADSNNVIFNNLLGTFQTSASGGQTLLNLTGSSLNLVNNLGAPYDCPPPSCVGTVSLTTGALTSGFPSLTTGSATFAPGGTFDVVSTSPGAAFTFHGTFSSESWTESFATFIIGGKPVLEPFWTFVGSITGGELMLDGKDLMNIGAATIDLTRVGGNPIDAGGGQLKWSNSTGSTNFPSPVPEPSTLALFGSGLIAVGMVAKHRLGSC